MKRFFLIFALFSLISTSAVFSQSEQSSQAEENKAGSDSGEAFAIIPELEAEEVSNLGAGRNRVVFKTNVKNCAIFLNGNLQGRSQLTLNNLIEGYYLLRVEKDGYDFQENFIYVEREKAKSFYIELQPNEETQKKEENAARSNAASAGGETASAQSDSSSQSAKASQNADSASFGDAK